MNRWRRSFLLLVLLVPLTGCDGNDDWGKPGPGSVDVPTEARDAYFVGSEFAGLPLERALVPPNGAGESTSFIYGDCEPPAEGGCAPPLEIQTWSSCDRPRQPGSQPFRGAQAIFSPRGAQVEIQTGSDIVVVFADNFDLAERAADEVRHAESSSTITDLAPPDRQAVSGGAECSDQSDPYSPEAEIADTVNAWADAVGDSDGVAACALMSESGQRDMKKPYSRITPGHDRPLAETCELAVPEVAKSGGRGAVLADDVTAEDVQIEGGSAVVQHDGSFCIFLISHAGEWRIMGLPLPPPDDPAPGSDKPPPCTPV